MQNLKTQSVFILFLKNMASCLLILIMARISSYFPHLVRFFYVTLEHDEAESA